MEVRKIAGESDVVSVFVVCDEGGLMEETDMLRLIEASRSPVVRMASWWRWTGN